MRAATRGYGLLLPQTLKVAEYARVAEDYRGRAAAPGIVGTLREVWITDDAAVGARHVERIGLHMTEEAGSWWSMKGRFGFEARDQVDRQVARGASQVATGTSRRGGCRAPGRPRRGRRLPCPAADVRVRRAGGAARADAPDRRAGRPSARGGGTLVRFLLEHPAPRGLDDLVACAEAARAAGLDGVLVAEWRELPGALVSAAMVAARVEEVLIAAEVTIGARHPVEIAEEVAVTDLACGGRLVLVARSSAEVPERYAGVARRHSARPRGAAVPVRG